MIVSEVVDAFVGGNHVTCDQIRDINLGTYGSEDYVLSTGQKFKAELLSNNTLRIFDGVAIYGGVRDVVAVNSYHDVTIENGTQGMNRNDIAVRYFSINEKTRVGSAIFKMIKGTPTNGEALDPEIEVTDLRAGALEHSMLFYRVRLEGLNVVAVEPLFSVLMTMAELEEVVNELNSKLSNVAIRGGSKIVTITSGSDAVVLFSLDQIRSLFGHLTTQPYNYTVSATNGDGKSSGHHLHGTTWLDNNLYVLSNQVASGNISTRVNYVIFYSP